MGRLTRSPASASTRCSRFEGMGPSEVLVVRAVDGKPLPAAEGPFRIAVLTDKESSRSLRQLQKLEVKDVGTR